MAASAVCLGHVLVLLAVWELRQAAPRGVADKARPVVIRLLPERRQRAPRAEPAAPAARAQPPRLPLLEAVTPVEPARVSSTLVPVAAAASSAAGDAAGQAGAVAAASGAGSAPLSLKPSREVLLGSLGSNPAVTDPRSNTPKPTFEERLAMGLNPALCVKLERLPDGSIRRSMGRLSGALTSAQATGLTTGGGAGGAGAGQGGPGGPSGASILAPGGGGGGGVKTCV